MAQHTREAQDTTIPIPGFGTSGLSGENARRMIEEALELGYRHVDTAEDYGNEAEIGKGWSASGLDRSDLFLTSKVWPSHFSRRDFRSTVEGSLERLRTDHLDLLLLHWPVFEEASLEDALDHLNRARDDGLARSIGVSNFTVDLLNRARSHSPYPLLTNQVEYHPFLDQDELLEVAKGHDMVLTAYCPVARGRTVRDEVLQEIGRTHGKTGAQVSLRWLIQQGAVPIPRTSDPDHARQNLEVFDFHLDEEEMRRIHALHEPDGRIIDPSGMAPSWD